jgi:hypothetical protein
MRQISVTLPAKTDPTASRRMFERERARAQFSSGAAAADATRGLGRHVLSGRSGYFDRFARALPQADSWLLLQRWPRSSSTKRYEALGNDDLPV